MDFLQELFAGQEDVVDGDADGAFVPGRAVLVHAGAARNVVPEHAMPSRVLRRPARDVRAGGDDDAARAYGRGDVRRSRVVAATTSDAPATSAANPPSES